MDFWSQKTLILNFLWPKTLKITFNLDFLQNFTQTGHLALATDSFWTIWAVCRWLVAFYSVAEPKFEKIEIRSQTPQFLKNFKFFDLIQFVIKNAFQRVVMRFQTICSSRDRRFFPKFAFLGTLCTVCPEVEKTQFWNWSKTQIFTFLQVSIPETMWNDQWQQLKVILGSCSLAWSWPSWQKINFRSDFHRIS